MMVRFAGSAEAERAAVLDFINRFKSAADAVAEGMQFFDSNWGVSDCYEPGDWRAQATAAHDLARAIQNGWHIPEPEKPSA